MVRLKEFTVARANEITKSDEAVMAHLPDLSMQR